MNDSMRFVLKYIKRKDRKYLRNDLKGHSVLCTCLAYFAVEKKLTIKNPKLFH
jgi:hypothetical protein